MLAFCKKPRYTFYMNEPWNLCDSFHFPVGAAINSWNLDEKDAHHGLLSHFNAFVYENEMKPRFLQPQKGVFTLEKVKALADFGKAANVSLRGHTLLWHQDMPDWFFQGSAPGTLVEPEQLYERIHDHISTVMQAAGNSFGYWDVANERIGDDGTLRHDTFLDICKSDEYLQKAFEYARKAAPAAKLFLNDYCAEFPGSKQDGFFNELARLLEKGTPIDGVGLQGHISLYHPSVQDFKEAIERFASLGLAVHITELDMSFYKEEKEPELSLSNEMLTAQAERYKALFDMFSEEHAKGNLEMVLFWGLSDDCTWLNSFPVKERKNWPLLFDRDLTPKPCLLRLVGK